MKFVVFPYKMGSKSAKLIARELGAKRVYPDRNYRPHNNHIVINWGSARRPAWGEAGISILNTPYNVEYAGNKLLTFEVLRGGNVSIPEFTTVIEEAEEWADEGFIVVCRQTLTGSQGRGIVIAGDVDSVVQAPLYTKHVRHKHEFRVHVFKGEVIDFTQKKKRRDLNENVSQYVRNHEGGWVFYRDGVVLPDKVREQAIAAVNALGLDFGAVDVGYREREDKAYVFEVNCAPGLDEGGTTLTKYVEAFRSLLSTT